MRGWAQLWPQRWLLQQGGVQAVSLVGLVALLVDVLQDGPWKVRNPDLPCHWQLRLQLRRQQLLRLQRHVVL